ncbi:MAG: tetratricopeptide repeat protein [Promethearchaeota archaeon]
MYQLNPEELIKAKKLINDGQLDEALQLINNYEEKGETTIEALVSCHLLKCNLLYQQGLFENIVKLAEQTYKESLELGNNLLSVDAILQIALALINLYKLEKGYDLIKQGEELLKLLKFELPTEYKQREANLAYVKGMFYWQQGDADQALKHLEHSLALCEELDIEPGVAQSLFRIAWILGVFKGELDRALEYAERSMVLAKEINNKFNVAWSLNVMAVLHSFKGDLGNANMLFKQSLVIFEELNNKIMTARVLNNITSNYRKRGELNLALESIEKCIAINKVLGDLRHVANNHDFLIKTLIDMGDINRAQHALYELEQLKNQLNDKIINLMYILDKALVLKTSLRARNRGKAEELFIQILEVEDISYEDKIVALINLCELLLIELRITNDLEVLDELKQYITQLLDIADHMQSYWILCETYLLQAKLSLLTFDIKKARRFLIQAQQIAERFYLTQLKVKITNENMELLKKLDLWERLKETDAPIAERMKLARLDDKIEIVVQDSTILTAQVREEKVDIYKKKKICLVCRGEVLRFSYICECGTIYCENCARALTNLENACWTCEAPIDYTKPVKLYKEEENKKIEEKGKKKQN